MGEKTSPAASLKALLAPLRAKGAKVVFTNGCFDLIHPGHVSYLTEAKKLGDILVVGLNSDDSVRRQGKGRGRPVMNQEERAAVLSGLKPVDHVLIFDEDTPINLIKELVPDVLVKGGDWAVENIVGRDVVEAGGGIVRAIPYIEGNSTTNIVERIKKSLEEG